jgi:hypothetical protein
VREKEKEKVLFQFFRSELAIENKQVKGKY